MVVTKFEKGPVGRWRLQRFAVQLNFHPYDTLALLVQKVSSVRGVHHWCRWVNNRAKSCRQRRGIEIGVLAGAVLGGVISRLAFGLGLAFISIYQLEPPLG
jgi:hypothetical protein